MPDNDPRLTPSFREEFDRLVDEIVAGLPPIAEEVLHEVPLVVLDCPDPNMLKDLGMSAQEADELCGLHTGVMRTEQSLESPELSGQIHIFRLGLAALAGGADETLASEDARQTLKDEIRTTILHEIGHELGLEEDDLDRLGYA